jgi:hypothetical protein
MKLRIKNCEVRILGKVLPAEWCHLEIWQSIRPEQMRDPKFRF